MGITLHVESITPIAPGTTTPYPIWVYQVKQAQAYLKVICTNFGWEKTPWQEPSEIKGTTQTSANYTRYALFQNVARGYYGLLEKVRPEDGWGDYPHLLKHAEFRTYYIPVDFQVPCILEAREFDPNDDPFSVGSSFGLAHEMRQLEWVFQFMIAKYGADGLVPGSNRTWDALYDFQQLLLKGAEESIALNLPFSIRY